jgi:hypothetical protein
MANHTKGQRRHPSKERRLTVWQGRSFRNVDDYYRKRDEQYDLAFAPSAISHSLASLKKVAREEFAEFWEAFGDDSDSRPPLLEWAKGGDGDMVGTYGDMFEYRCTRTRVLP